MLKKYFSILFIFIGLFSNAQSLTNEKFESWIDNTAFVEPEGWITLNDLNPEYGLPLTVLKTTDAAEGKYAAQLQTFTYMDGDNVTDTLASLMVYSSDITSGIHYPWTKRLKNISFQYKYLPNGIDSGLMYITVGYRDKKTNQLINQGGTYFLFSKREENYAKANLPLYYSNNHKCDTFIFVFINSVEKPNGNRNKPGTILKIDDIQTEWEDFPPVVEVKLSEAETDFGIYPNPVNDKLFLKGLKYGNYNVSIFDLSGRIVRKELNTNRQINVIDLLPGLYHIQINSEDGNYYGSHNFYKN